MANVSIKSSLRLLSLSLISIFTTSAISIAQTNVLRGEYIVQRKFSQDPVVAQSSAFQTVDTTLTADLVSPKASLTSANPSDRIVPLNAAQVAADCAEILKDPSVLTCEPNVVMQLEATFPNDPGFQFQTGLHDPIANQDIDAPEAWDQTRGSKDVVVGIIDSGINYLHPDLQPNIWRNPGETAGNGKDDDSNGYVDDVFGINAHLGISDPTDCNGHGSHVAGIIGAAGNNGIGVTGVNWNISMIMAAVPVDCGPSISTMGTIKAADYFYDLKRNRGINIIAINASYGGSVPNDAVKASIDRLRLVNIVFVVAAGNGGQDGIGDSNDFLPQFPASYDLDNIVVVANMDYNGFLNESSNYGAVSVDVAAPGTDILSTVNGSPGNNEVYDYKTGTSMAAPMVTGMLGLLYSQRPFILNYQTLIKVLFDNVYPYPTLQGKVKTGGLSTALKLVTASALPDACPSDPFKIEAGLCGCGVPESYTDSDGDNVANCADSCSADKGKTLPGVCGCGVPDADANVNGQVDCLDALIINTVPAAPGLKKKKGKLEISVAPNPNPGITYVITVSTKNSSKKGAKPKVKNYSTASPVFSVKAPGAGNKVTVSYYYQIGGAAIFNSASSPAKTINFK